MNLDELKKEAYEDLPITKEEHLDQEAFKNQELKAKWLDYKSRFELLLVRNKGEYQRLYRDKWEYYGGKADAKVYVAKPFDLKVLKLQPGDTFALTAFLGVYGFQKQVQHQT